MATALTLLDSQRGDLSRVLKLLESNAIGAASKSRTALPPILDDRPAVDTKGAPFTQLQPQQRPHSAGESQQEGRSGGEPASPSGGAGSAGSFEKDNISPNQGASFTRYINKLQAEVRRRTDYLTLLDMDGNSSMDMAGDGYGQRRPSTSAAEAVSYASKALDSVRNANLHHHLPKKAFSFWMIDPASPVRIAWDLVVLMPFLVYLTVMMPFRLSFNNEPEYGSGVWMFEFVIELIFLVDIAIHFRTGYFLLPLQRDEPLKNIPVEYDSILVAKNYLSSWFVLDLLSGVPFMLIDLVLKVSNGINALKVIKSTRLLRLLKLMRVFKVESIFSSMDREVVDSIEDFLHDKQVK